MNEEKRVLREDLHQLKIVFILVNSMFFLNSLNAKMNSLDCCNFLFFKGIFF